MQIFYEDNHILVAYKPRGILSQADGSDRLDMLTELKDYIKEKYHKEHQVYLGLVHRLDINTSGIMVFARTSKAAARLAEAMRQGQFTKRYLAIVEGKLENKGRIESFLKKNEAEKKSYVTTSGQKAVLTYEVLDFKDNRTLLDIELLTGRFHQIRCQFASLGHPLYGDKKYGSQFVVDPLKFPLEAYYLSFPHPITKEILVFQQKTLHL